MNLGTILVTAVIAVLLFSAVRHVLRHGACSACGNAKNCCAPSSDCGEHCGGCPHSGTCHSK